MRLLLFILLFVFSSRAAVLFDGADDIIGFGDAGDEVFKEDAAFSFSCWFNASSDGESSTGIFIRRGGNILRITATDAIRFNTQGLTIRTSANSSFSLNAWNHLVFTWDGNTNAADVHIYVNTAEVSYATTTNGAVPTNNVSDSLNIGNSTTTANTFAGQITECATWSSVLTTAQRTALFYGKVRYMPIQVSPTTITGYWPLDDFADGATVTGAGLVVDRRNKLNNGTATNSPVAKAGILITYP